MKFVVLSFLFLALLARAEEVVHLDYPACADALEFGDLSAAIAYVDDYNRLEDEFLASPRVLYRGRHAQPEPGGEFYTSNEFDFHRGPLDFEPTDLVVGFATSNVWDIAVRKRAKAMVIADWSASPLLVQEFVLRPLFKYANSRDQFLYFLRGIASSAGPTDENTERFFARILRAENTQTGEQHDEFVRALLARVQRDPDFGQPYAVALARFFSTVMIATDMESHPDIQRYYEKNFSPPLVPSPNGWEPGFMASRLVDRYAPQVTRYSGEKPLELVNQPWFSFLASEEAFQYLRSMFVGGRVWYAHAGYADQDLYRAAGRFLREHGWSRVAISTSNIIDCMADGNRRFAGFLFRDFVAETTRTLLDAGAQAPLTFFRTLRTEPPHTFDRHVVCDRHGL